MMNSHAPHRRYQLVLMGPPGAGKTTVSRHLTEHVPLEIIATGKRLRDEVAQGSAIGREVAGLLDQGRLVPDELLNRLMRHWIASVPAGQGFLLDGYPRSLDQAHALDRILTDLQQPLDAVVSLELSQEEAIRRLTGRRICKGGGENFTLHISDAAAVQRCQERGGQLVQRDDDRPDVVQERMRVYARETQPLLAFYTRRGLLRTVNAEASPEHMTTRILQMLEP